MFFDKGTIDTKMMKHDDTTFLDVTLGLYKMIYSATIDRVGCVHAILCSFLHEIGRDALKPLEHPPPFSRLFIFLSNFWPEFGALALVLVCSRAVKVAKRKLRQG